MDLIKISSITKYGDCTDLPDQSSKKYVYGFKSFISLGSYFIIFLLLTMKFSLAEHEILLGILIALLHFCLCVIEICCCFCSINVNLFQLTEVFVVQITASSVSVWIPWSYSSQPVSVFCWFLEKQF